MHALIFHRLVRIVYPFGKVTSPLTGPVKGMKFTIRPGMGFTYAIGKDAWNWRWLKDRVHWKGATVYDIGANRGQMTLWLAKMVGKTGTVVAFEPVPSLFEDLVGNIHLNNLTNVRPYCVAVSNAPGETTFAFNQHLSTSGKILKCEPTYTDSRANHFTVRTVSLDDMVQEGRVPPPDFLKIDVEGGAGLVLQGATKVIEQYAPRIYIETHGPEERVGIRDCLVQKGYVVENLAGERVPDPTINQDDPLWCFRLAGYDDAV